MIIQSERLAELLPIPAGIGQIALSDVLSLKEFIHYAAHVLIQDDSGVVTGDLSIEVSNGALGGVEVWETLDSKVGFSAGSQMWMDKNVPYAKFRIRFVNQSAESGFMSVLAVIKGEN